jgi:hypothetical protein
MKTTFKKTDLQVRTVREIPRRYLSSTRRSPFDAVAYAAVLEMLG